MLAETVGMRLLPRLPRVNKSTKRQLAPRSILVQNPLALPLEYRPHELESILNTCDYLAQVMVPVPAVTAIMHNKMHSLSLQSASAELRYEHSTHQVDIIAKDEDIRRLRFDIHVLEDDNDELRELLAQEEERSDTFGKLVNGNLERAEDAEARLQEVETALRATEQQIGTLQAEANALKTTAADSEAFLTEKLALTRELSILRPELEHLKTQAASNEILMAEKLDLQRQLSEIQCELENAKRDTKRALAKRRNTGIEIAKEVEVDDLRRELAKEKRARQRAEDAADATQNDTSVDDVRKQLAREKRARQKAEEELEAARENTQLEDVRKDLLKEKKAKQKAEDKVANLETDLEQASKAAKQAAKRAEGSAEADEQVEELRQELAKEKKERMRLEKVMREATDEFDTQKTMLDDKLGQFRTKLRSTKEKLKETQSELEQVKANVATAPAPKNTKKRTAELLDVEAAPAGSPGAKPAAKKGRKAPPSIVEASAFSITPFLNRTINAAADSDDENDAAEASPSTGTAAAKRPKALALKSASDGNVQKKAAPRQRKQKAPMLDMVTEEAAEEIHNQGQENAAHAKQPKAMAMKIKTKTDDGPGESEGADGVPKKKRKVRKSLADFETFTQEPELEKKKKRKLGGIGKSFFDDDDDAVAPIKAKPGRVLLGMKALGTFGNKKSGGFLGASRTGSSFLAPTEVSGFQFSPLKRSRTNLDDTLRA